MQKCEKEYGNHPTNLCESCGTDNEANEMTPDKLIEVLKRYQRESNQSERTLAARIGVNYHTVNRWLKDTQCPMKGRLALAASFLRRVGYM
jgi:3-methyladenine DNA glycosylase Mpg